MEFDIGKGFEIIEYAKKQKQEEELRNRWVNGYQSISFSEFKSLIYENARGTGVESNISVDEIEDKVRNILMQRGWESGDI